MDSLLANYASSSDEEKEEVKQPKQQKPSSLSLFSSLPPPSFTSTSTSLQRNKGGLKEPAPPASFSSLPPPSSSVPKRVVEFRPPPIKPFNFNDDEDEETDRDQKRRKESQSNSSVGSSSVKSFLSNIPAPKNSFSALGGRRSAMDTQTPTSANAEASKVETDPASNSGKFDSEAASYAGYESGVAQNDDAFNTQPPTSSGSDAYGVEHHPTTDYGSFYPNAAYYANNETGYDQNPGQYVDAGNGSYEVYGHQHGNKWGDGSVAAIPQTESALRILGKRSKIPAEIVEVKQDELMKNRPREDQSKMTGIAFGPSYQPVSSKGKPTKLHKRKHQIGSLFFDMKQKEMELAERRSKGFLTKAETHAKYGW